MRVSAVKLRLPRDFSTFEVNNIVKNPCEKKPIEFTLLLCTYKNDNPAHLRECLTSILSGTVLPNEMIIVKDGLLTAELDEVIATTNFPFEVNIISLPTNQTLGIARATGVIAAKHNWIALMDSDDIALPNRFELQLAKVTKNPEIDILGGQIAEFDVSPNQTHALRKVPISHGDIIIFAKTRNPFNAMTVMFNKDLAIESGNFRYFPGFEDYDLWVRMIKNGAKCQNCEDVLVYARTGMGLYARRRGISYAKHEWLMQRNLLSLKTITKIEFLRNILIRIPIRLLPQRIVELAYRTFSGRVVLQNTNKRADE